MLRFALIGAGRIGRMHADNLAANPGVALTCVYDVHMPSAAAVAGKHGARVAADIAGALGADVDAVLIAAATDTHVDLITAAARAGKAVLCEKPIDLDIARVDRCWQEIKDTGVPVQIAFNRRYDPTHKAVRDAIVAGEVGTVEQILIVSRDPAPPPAAYIEVSGGLYRDMMIHDFDLARFLLGEEPVAVSAFGSVLVDPAIADLGDVDTAMVTLRAASGALVHIANSRRAVYGYDQRVEVFGSGGMVQSGNRRESSIARTSATHTGARAPLMNFFIERYTEAYVAEIDDFVAAVEAGRTPSVTFEDGRRALMLADAAVASLTTGKVVDVPGQRATLAP